MKLHGTKSVIIQTFHIRQLIQNCQKCEVLVTAGMAYLSDTSLRSDLTFHKYNSGVASPLRLQCSYKTTEQGEFHPNE